MKARPVLTVILTISLLGGSIAAWAQSPKVARVGVLDVGSAADTSARITAFRNGLRELGHVDGQNITIEWRLRGRAGCAAFGSCLGAGRDEARRAGVYFHRRQLAELAVRNRLAWIGADREYAEAGCLRSYGPDRNDLVRQAASYVDRILKGAKPADLPVEEPTKLELIVNLRTAKALGLTIPSSILSRADQRID